MSPTLFKTQSLFLLIDYISQLHHTTHSGFVKCYPLIQIKARHQGLNFPQAYNGIRGIKLSEKTGG